MLRLNPGPRTAGTLVVSCVGCGAFTPAMTQQEVFEKQGKFEFRPWSVDPSSPFSLARRIQDAVDELNGACAAAASAGLTVELDVVTDARIGTRPDCPLVSATVTRVERIVPEGRP